MLVPVLRVGCLACLFLYGAAELRAQAQKTPPATFRTSTQMVLIPLTVTDQNGRAVEGLQAKDFAVFDNSVAQPIVSLTSEDLPFSAGLVLDISGSMRLSMDATKDAARTFLETANPDDEFLLLTVSTLPAATPEFTTETVALEDSIGAARPGGLTALIDTVYLGLNQMRKASHGQRALVILSDGIDNHSQYSRNELLRLALEADVQIYTVIMDNGARGAQTNTVPFRPVMIRKPGDPGPEQQGPKLLEELADKTGGLSFHARNDAQAKDAMMKAGRALRTQYVIGYRMPDSGAPGKWHQVRVKSTAAKVHIHARSGYYAP